MTQQHPEQTDQTLRIQVDPELEHIIPIFLEEMQEYVQALAEALVRADHEAVALLGHTIKGTAANFGLFPVSELGRALERAGQGRDAAGGELLRVRLSAMLEQISTGG